MNKPAFTLIETLISLAIIVSVLGSVTAVNRIVQTSALQSESDVQLSSLVDESLVHLRTLRDATPGDTAGTSNFNTALAFPSFSVLGQSNDVAGLFVARPAQELNPCNTITAQCNPEEKAGPIQLTWCNPASSTANSCNALASPITNTGQPQSVQEVFTSHSQAELIAIRRTPATASDSDKRSIVDLSSLNGTAPALALSDTTGKWTYYTRTITIKSVSVTKSHSGGLIGPGGTGGGGATLNSFNINQSSDTYSYLATVTVTQYGAPKVTMTRSIILYALQ
jgi:Tfp pilus assembly protein PilV